MNFYKTIEANTDQMVSDISTLIKYKSIQGEAEDGMPYGKEMDDALDCCIWIWQRKWVFGQRSWMDTADMQSMGKAIHTVGIFSHVDVNDEDDNEWKCEPLRRNRRSGKDLRLFCGG